MLNVNYSIDAINSLNDIYNYISIDNEFYADKVISSIMGYIRGMLAIFPNLGKRITKNGLRLIIEPTFKYKIFYKIEKNNINISFITKYQNKDFQ